MLNLFVLISVSKAVVSTVSLLEAIAAQALMSALTIEPSSIFAEVIALSFIFADVTALLLILSLVTALSVIEPDLTFYIGIN